MKLIKEWPTLQAKAKSGRIKYWKIGVYEENPGEIYVIPMYWQGEEGTRQTAPKRVRGVNMGRSNETTDVQQAHLEAQSEWLHQKDRGYQEAGEDTSARLPLPMLAQDYTKEKYAEKILFPCFAQPKLDGHRILFNKDLGWWSRQGKPPVINLSHLEFDTGDLIFDGELILPPGYSFQDTCKAIKKERDETKLLHFHVFDIVDPNRGFLGRFERLHLASQGFPDQVQIVPTRSLVNSLEAEATLALFLQNGHEGLILRNYEGGYEVGNRSNHLQKFKRFDTAEFKVVGVTEGEGREEGAAILICETPEGRRFNVRPRGDYPFRRQLFQLGGYQIGKMWTVRFQGYSTDKIPRFPVGISERLD